MERRETVPIFNPDYDDYAYSAHQIDHLAAAVAGDLDEEEVAAWAEDLRVLGRAGEYFFSLNRYLFLFRKPGAGQTVAQ